MNQLQAPSQYDAPTVVTLRRTFAALRRDWKLALLPIVLIPVATYILASNGSPRYQAAASVLLNRGNLANSVIGASDPTQSETDADVVATQLQVAQSTAVLTRAVQLIGRPASSARQLASNSSVAPSGTSLVITFSVDEATPNLAQRLANAYAHAYVAYRHQIDSQPYTAALQAVQAKVAQLRSAGGAGSQAVVNSLASREEQLVTLETLQVGNVSVLSQAATAAQIAPRSTKDTALALLIAIVLGLGAVLGKDAFDTRVRNQEAISEFSDVPVIGSLPTPSTRWPSVDQLVQPGSHYSNAVAITRANLGFAFVGDRHGIVVVTSSLPSEGKTTTTVNLAISLARSGRRVAVVDLDLRRPTVAEFIPNPPRRGFTDVVLGTTTLKDVMCDVDLGPNMRSWLLCRLSNHHPIWLSSALASRLPCTPRS
jgi:capsular polysaccharide biosynthesis protein